MAANIITLARITGVFFAVWLFGINFYTQVIAFILTIIIYMDALDGWIARRLHIASDFGALLDITGDRIVENVYWIYFTSIGMISFWIPLIIITRSFLVDTVRTLSFAEGKTPFGKKTIMRSPFTRLLVSSRLSRTIYGILKVVIFCYLGGLLALKNGIVHFTLNIPAYIIFYLDIAGQGIVYIVVICAS